MTNLKQHTPGTIMFDGRGSLSLRAARHAGASC
jgi:hypothetical protein